MNDAILSALRHLKLSGMPVELLNIYQGVPVVYPARVEAVSAHEARLHIARHEIICLTLEKTVRS